MKKSGAGLALALVVAAAVSIGYLVGRTGDSAVTAQDVSPTEAQDRDVYVPNTEDLAPDEMRVIACGTGMPTTRAAQAAACFLVELGNGDKFLFDVGSGSAERISSLQIPYDYLDKIFLSHLHGDHFGALGELYIGGSLMGRHVPLRIWGPSGASPELGTAYAVQKMEEMYTWDVAGRLGVADVRGIAVQAMDNIAVARPQGRGDLGKQAAVQIADVGDQVAEVVDSDDAAVNFVMLGIRHFEQ